MTLTELRNAVNLVAPLVTSLDGATSDLRALLEHVQADVDEDNPLLSAIFPDQNNVDNYYNVQAAVYIQRLTVVETKADLLGSDILH